MSDKFYIQVRGKRQGPYTVERLRHMAKLGRFGRQHRVSKDGRRWKSADEFPELFKADGKPKTRRTAAEAEGQGAAGITAAAGMAAGGTRSSAGWFYSHDAQQYGPVSFEVIKHTQQTGGLGKDDLVWTNGMSEWKKAEQVFPGLFDGSAADTAAAEGYVGESPDGVQAPALVMPHAPMSNMAIVALLVSWIPVAGVICGHIALNQIDSSGGRVNGRNLALGALWIGYGILTVAVLVGLFLLSSSMFAPGDAWMPELVDPSSARRAR